MSLKPIAATLASLALAPAALAQAPAAPLSPEAGDARCVVVLGFIAAQPNQPADKLSALRAGSMYYVGKLKGRSAGLDIPATLNRAAQQAQAAKVDVRTEAARCGRELTAISQIATARARAAAPKK